LAAKPTVFFSSLQDQKLQRCVRRPFEIFCELEAPAVQRDPVQWNHGSHSGIANARARSTTALGRCIHSRGTQKGLIAIAAGHPSGRELVVFCNHMIPILRRGGRDAHPLDPFSALLP